MLKLWKQRFYVGLILLAIGLRLLWAIAVPVMPLQDSYAYDTFAQNLANGDGYGWLPNLPTAYWPVGTSLIYAAFYRLFGYTYWPIIAFNLCLSGITTGLMMQLAEMWFGVPVAIVAGLLFVLWPSQIQFTTILASELIFNTLILTILWIWFRERLSFYHRAAWVGVLMAAASYVRPTALLIPVLLYGLRGLAVREHLETLKAAVITVTLMAVLIAPWSIRNTLTFGQFVTISTNGGANFWMGNNPDSTGRYMELPDSINGMNEAVRDDYLKNQAIAHIKAEPLLFLKRTVLRIITTYARQTIGVAWNQGGLIQRYGPGVLMPLKIVSQLFWLPVLGLAILGILRLKIEKGPWAALLHPLTVLWGYFIAIHAIIVAEDRYNFPAVPSIGILSAVAIVYCLKRLHRRLNPS